FQYDIWGDTVNTTSRMRLRPDLSGESSGEVGQVNISEATYELVKNASTPLGVLMFGFTSRGKVHAKGKGEMEMYFVDHS
ncbi:MAG: adenylate/guanylate cyclase domain-containing protein, partial [Flavobacteriales bacterium]